MLPDKVERLCQRAVQAIAERDWEKAKQAYLMALGLRSDLPDVHYGLATVYFQLRELTSAAHHFREVVRLDPARTSTSAPCSTCSASTTRRLPRCARPSSSTRSASRATTTSAWSTAA